jgi:hypothetical protein
VLYKQDEPLGTEFQTAHFHQVQQESTSLRLDDHLVLCIGQTIRSVQKVTIRAVLLRVSLTGIDERSRNGWVDGQGIVAVLRT